jgi:DNA (cytosine-5)-methyltransferase 1
MVGFYIPHRVKRKDESMLKILSLFSGIGAFEKALDNLEVPYELVNFCEIDKYAVKSYCTIHGVDESKNLGDITKVDETQLPKDVDIMTYGFPCQDISLAGKQQGLFNKDGTQTRSGLFFEALRIIEATKPKIAIAENVKNLVGKKFNAQFQVVLASLDAAGYNCYWKVLNAKDFGVPQNRERVFIVSIRKDIDHGLFEFPEGYPLEKRLKDVLEVEVDEKYYLSEKMIRYIVSNNDKWTGNNGESLVNKTIASTLNTAEGSRRYDASNYIANDLPENFDLKTCEIKQVGQMYPNSGNPQAGRVYDAEGISPTMDTCSGGNRMPKILVPEPTSQRIDIPQTVKVRKYPVDTKKLVEVLRVQKQKCGWTNKELAEELDLPITTVEHYFRTDECFAIPEPQVWEDLKYLLEMDDIHEFDESIMTFEEKEGVFEKSERHYFDSDISPTLTVATAGNEKIITTDEFKIWDGFNQRVRADSSVVGTITRNVGADLKRNGQGIIESSPLRIRKLTPKECFRLMGFDDESFYRAEKVNSNTQLYKQAGNSIVVDVLEELFCMMLDENGKIYV